MANWEITKQKIEEGWVVALPSWACKSIRSYKDSDADFFQSEFDTATAIIQECHKPCDCIIGIWVPEEGEKRSDEWMLLYNHKIQSK